MTTRRAWAAFVVLGVPVLLGAVLALWCSMLRLDERLLFAQLSAFRVQVAGALLVLGALFLVRRGAGRAFGILLVLVALSPLPQLLPRMLADAPPAAGDLTILVLNVYADEVDPADVAALAVTRGAAVVSLPEASATFAAAVVERAAAAGVRYLSATDGTTPGPPRTSLLVDAGRQPSFRLGEPGGRFGSVTADLAGARPLMVAAVHPVPPVPGREAAWRADHATLARACAAGGPLVLAGDFNSTLDQSPMRDVLAAGCGDAAEATGHGLHGTWPAGYPGPVQIPIDHVLLTPEAGVVTAYEVLDVPGTDHRGLLVTIGPAVIG